MTTRQFNLRIEALLAKVRIAPADNRQKLMREVRKLRIERDMAVKA